MNKEFSLSNKTQVLHRKPDSGNPHIRFEEGESALAPRSGLYRNTIMKLGVAALASASLALGAAGNVYDEAKVWFRGGYDANDDGIFAASEFVDSSRPKSDTAHQTVTLTGNGVQYQKGAVWSAFNPFYT